MSIINQTGSIANVNLQSLEENPIAQFSTPKYLTTPYLTPEQINQTTLKNIKTKEIYKLGSDLVRNIIK